MRVVWRCVLKEPESRSSCKKVEVSWEGAPPEREEPACDAPQAMAGVPSIQPVRTPGPMILEKLPLLTVWP
jgi:hypothetical protein